VISEIKLLNKQKKETTIPTELKRQYNDNNSLFSNYNELKNTFSFFNTDFYIAKEIINQTLFNINKCISFLMNYFHKKEYDNLVLAIFYKDCTFDKLTLFLKLSTHKGMIDSFFNIYDKIETNLKYVLMALLYQRYYVFMKSKDTSRYGYNPIYEEDERNRFFELVDINVINEIRKITNDDDLKKILRLKEMKVDFNFSMKDVPKTEVDLKEMINEGKFDEIKKLDKELFFRSFFFLGQYSVSHFLSYLEVLRENFILSDDEQKMFVNIFEEVFEGRESFCKFVMEKLRFYEIITI